MTEALWAAVDAITQPTTRRVFRDNTADESWLADLAKPSSGFCRVEDYRAGVVSHGVVPSLWEQAEMALTREGESSSRSLLSTRSVADVTLMEAMLDIKEMLGQQFEYWKRIGKPVGIVKPTVPAQLRQLASHAATRFPDTVDEWTYRVAQWRRILETDLQAVEQGPKPLRLRVRCPRCWVEHVTIPDPNGGDPIVVRPLLAVYRDKYFRCFQCTECGHAWFGDSGVHELHAEVREDELAREAARDTPMAG